MVSAISWLVSGNLDISISNQNAAGDGTVTIPVGFCSTKAIWS